MINITNNEIKFNNLEEKMWKKKMQEGLDELRDQLRRIDYQLLKSRNNECLEPKDFQSTTIKCRFGDNAQKPFVQHSLWSACFGL